MRVIVKSGVWRIESEAMQKPTVRAETVLDGIFSQAVAVIEADSDGIVYQAAWEIVGQDRNFDNRLQVLPNMPVRAIYFGCRSEQADVDALIKAFRGTIKKIYKLQMSSERFRYSRQPVAIASKCVRYRGGP